MIAELIATDLLSILILLCIPTDLFQNVGIIVLTIDEISGVIASKYYSTLNIIATGNVAQM